MVPETSCCQDGSPLVVKIGGSLCDRVPDLVPSLVSSDRPLFIVPGGGRFADTVRSVSVDDDSAHWMAIAAMDQYGWYIASHGLPVTRCMKIPDHPVIFIPYCTILKEDPLPHTWDVTSDTVAAWVAKGMGLDLLLLKSVDGIREHGSLKRQINQTVETDVVDPSFIPFVLDNRIKTMIINGSRSDRVKNFLSGMDVPGTRIGTTF